ncbi:MAG: hypothetical protein QOK43_1967 [Acidimicrobiaceae bacterium]|nr:hypothetical protein [Acidimicrobiaceae bacterium]
MSGVLTELRDFVPIRPLRRAEALRIAEQQAARFLRLAGVAEPPVPMRIITDLPRLLVEQVHWLPVSGVTDWSNGYWMILLRSAEPPMRQRFSLAHEFKHILDDRFRQVLYQAVPQHERKEFVEAVCDFFAGCLLVPRPWLKAAWGSGLQAPKELAERFAVSQRAMEVRLQQTGLSGGRARCGVATADWSLQRPENTESTGRYYRRRPLAPSNEQYKKEVTYEPH